MSTSIVLTEKLRRPDGSGLERPRLLEPLRRTDTALGLVVAPAGSGKTTLLGQVAAAGSGPVAWYRLDGNDRAESSFLAHLARVLTDALAREVADASLPHLLASLPATIGAAPTGSGGGADDGALLVLDDLQEIAGSPAERLVEQLIALRPPWLRMLAGSRRTPEVNIPRLRVSGALIEVTADDLRWRSWEVEELFLSHFQEPLSPEAAAALARRTGGWAAALQLFHLSTTRRPTAERNRAVDELGGRSKLIRSYLASNVLAGLTPERQTFLRRTCALEPLTADLCDGLLGTRGSAAVLDELEQQQLFTVSDDDGETYHYHEVLRSHLQWSLVQHEGPDAARGWYRRSARLLEQVGAVRGAVRAAVQAEDWPSVARLMRTTPLTGDRGPVAGDGTSLPLPPSVVAQDPWLSLAQARRLLRSGSLEPSVAAFRAAEHLLDEPGFRSICRRERSVAQLWAGAASTSGWLSLDIRPATAHWSARLREATMRLPSVGGPGSNEDPTISRGAADHLVDALVRLLGGDLGGARTSLRWAAGAADRPESDRPFGTTGGTEVEPEVALLVDLATVVVDLLLDPTSDVPHPAAAVLIEIAAAADDTGQPWIARLARALREAALVRGDDSDGQSSWRRQACSDAVLTADRLNDPWGAAILQVVAATVAPDRDAARRAYADAAARFRSIGAPVVALWIDALLRTCTLSPVQNPAAGEPAADARVRQGARAMQVPAVIDLLAGGPARPDPARAVRIVDVVARHLLLPAASSPAVPGRPGRPGRPDAQPGGTSDVVRIRCFGGFALSVGDQPVDLTSLRPRARSLLRLLALHSDEDQHRERLIDALWPGVELGTGGRRLQVAVSAVRQVLELHGLSGVQVLRRRESAYRLLLPTGSEVDVHRFADDLRRAAAASGTGADDVAITARHAALARYTGDLLPEDGPAEWVVDERDRLRLQAAGAATRLADDLRRAGRPGPAVDAARRAIALDRFTDPAWELLIDLLAATGDASGAAHAQREHRRVQEDLDLIS